MDIILRKKSARMNIFKANKTHRAFQRMFAKENHFIMVFKGNFKVKKIVIEIGLLLLPNSNCLIVFFNISVVSIYLLSKQVFMYLRQWF